MIKSMTGFGRREVMEKNRKFTVEIKSVNHRYLDANVKLPKKLSFFESAIRSVLKEYIQRGKVDVFITYEDYTQDNFALKYNEELAGEYLKHLKAMSEKFGLDNGIRAAALASFPEVFVMEEQTVKEKEIWETLEKGLREACGQFVETRVREGENLKADLMEKLRLILSYVDFIETRYPDVLKEYRKKLEDKVAELLADKQIEEGRIAAEVTLFADKICVDEETVRLKSHTKAMMSTLEEGGSVGRKLDFIAQEMNREANTILSKATDLELSNVGIDLKTEIEKVREQIQNIE